MVKPESTTKYASSKTLSAGKIRQNLLRYLTLVLNFYQPLADGVKQAGLAMFTLKK